ncbi:hypothetical protein UCDDS831_g01362 [Diplodia seriata]|uniref:Uncharacterized protein n=1 Tax=Diplodia seriata TaxID=420778 RepID=A0A0G2EVJ4_9PEZI|nr:hypothetical protein UCDDS831_g01362 [Diplodia seriata]
MSATGWVPDWATIYEYCPLIWSFSILSLSITIWELKYRLYRMSKRITELYELIEATIGCKDKSINEERMKADLQILEIIAETMHAINSALVPLPDGECKDKVEALQAHLVKLALRVAYYELETITETMHALNSALVSLPDGESKGEVEALRARLNKVEVRIVYHEWTPQDATSDEKELL